MSLCYLSVVISIVAGVNLYDVDDYYFNLNILSNGNLYIPVHDLIVFYHCV